MENLNDVREPDDITEVQDFDLDDLLREFHDIVAEEPVEVEADRELEELLQMPKLTITPVVVKTSGAMAALLEDSEPREEEAPVSDAPTVVFEPITEDPAAQETREVPAIGGETTVLPQLDPEETAAEAAPAEPAFEVEPELIPEPILFQPKLSRLQELKKKLVAGPEKRFYELSELGTGKLQLAILASVVIVALSAGVTTLQALGMVPASRLRLVIFSQVLAMLLSALMGSHLMVDSVAELLKGRFTVNTLLTLTFAACFVDGVFCLNDLRIPCCAAFSLEMLFALCARYQKRNTEMSQMDTMRKAVRLQGIIKVEDYYQDKPGLMRKRADVEDFMDHYTKVSGPERV